ncbi:S8 family serine peptidase, partial [Candidatus Micrarchaeota archaeon]|nr:S8 family serine peptidase [Candidatus Micrarchaeota archaeon]
MLSSAKYKILLLLLLIPALTFALDAYEPDGSASNATVIPVNGTIQFHTIAPAADIDWYVFNATVGSKYLIRTSNLSGGADTVLSVYKNDSTTLIGYSDDVSLSVDVSSAFLFVPTANGTYYITVNDFSSSTNGANYSISVNRSGRLLPYLISPLSNITVNQSEEFNFSAGVTCSGGPCTDITATLDPKETLDGDPVVTVPKLDPQVASEIKKFGEASVIVQVNEGVTADRILSDMKKELKKGTAEFSKEEFESVSATVGSKKDWFSGNVSPVILEKLVEDPRIKKISFDYVMDATLSDSIPLIRANSVWNQSVNNISLNGSGQTVCVIDTGINYSHPDFTGAYLGGYDFVNNDGDPMDDHGHGSHVSGIIASRNETYRGVAPGAKIIAIKALNSGGSGSTSNIIKGIEWCTGNASLYNISVISMSLGFSGTPHNIPCDSDAFASSIQSAIAANITVVIASGNDGFGSSASTYPGISTPACVPGVISVGSTTKADAFSSFGNRALMLGVLAPGSSITSTYYVSGKTTLSGTSMATPHVAGLAALLAQTWQLRYNRTLTPSNIKNLIRYNGVQLSDSGTGLIYNRIDALASANAKGVVPMTAGSPFFTTTQNPSTSFDLAENASQNFTWLVTANYSSGGRYEFFAVFEDNNSDYNITSKINVSIRDLIAPGINLSSPLNQTYNRSNLTIIINTTGSDVDTVWFNNETANETYIIPVNRTFSDGNHTIIAWVNDSSGNINSTNVSFTIDTTAPLLTLNSPSNNTVSGNSSTEFNFTATDQLSLPFNCSLYFNSTLNRTNSSVLNNTLTNFTLNLSEGTYNWSIRCTDQAGNTNLSQNRNLTIDLSSPTLSIISPANTTYTTAQVRVNISASDLTLDSIWFYNGTANESYSSSVVRNSSEGSNTVIAYANDSVGRINSTNVSFLVDTTSPAFTSIQNLTIANGSAVGVQFNATDSNNISNWSINNSNFSINSTGHFKNSTSLAIGVYLVNLTATDGPGNNASAVIFVNVTPNPKILTTSILPAALFNGSTVQLYLTASNFSALWANISLPNGSIVNLTLSNGSNTSFSNTNLTGTYTVTFYANGSAGDIVNTTGSFATYATRSFSVNVTPYNSTGINSSFYSYLNSTLITNDSNSSGIFSVSIFDSNVTLNFSAFQDRVRVDLRSVNISNEFGKIFGLDEIGANGSYLGEYGVKNNYTFSNATITINYSNL